MEIRATTIFLKYIHRHQGEQLFITEYRREVQNRFDYFRMQGFQNVRSRRA